jgi:hypothetical protein
MDFIKDQNPTALYEVGIRAGDKLPEYVKNAFMLQEEDVAELAPVAFADPDNRLHPIHTKAATYMSAVYLAGAGKINTPEFTHVKQAAEFFEIDKDIDEALSLLEQPNSQKSASTAAEKQYALQFVMDEAGDDEVWRAYPINTDVEVVKAATDAVKDWVTDRIPTDWLVVAAKAITKRATELNLSRMDIPDKIWNLGEARVTDLEYAEDVAYARKAAGVTNVTPYVEAVKAAFENKISVEEAVETWMQLDMEHNVSHKRHSSPHEAFYSGIKESAVADMAAQHVFIEDVMIPASAVVSLANDDGKVVRRAFNKAAADKILSVIATLKADLGTSKQAATHTTSSFGTLTENQRKELLNILVRYA